MVCSIDKSSMHLGSKPRVGDIIYEFSDEYSRTPWLGDAARRRTVNRGWGPVGRTDLETDESLEDGELEVRNSEVTTVFAQSIDDAVFALMEESDYSDYSDDE